MNGIMTNLYTEFELTGRPLLSNFPAWFSMNPSQCISSKSIRWEWNRYVFPCSLHCVHLNTIALLSKPNIRRLRNGEKKAGQLGALGPKGWHNDEFSGFSLVFFASYPGLGVKEAGNPEMPTDAETRPPSKKFHRKNLFSPIKKPR